MNPKINTLTIITIIFAVAGALWDFLKLIEKLFKKEDYTSELEKLAKRANIDLKPEEAKAIKDGIDLIYNKIMEYITFLQAKKA